MDPAQPTRGGRLSVPPSRKITRRGFLAGSLTALVTPSLAGCFGTADIAGPASAPRLDARPGTPTLRPSPGASPLGLESGRDGVLYVPGAHEGGASLPLMVLLHGAGGSAADWETVFPVAEARGIVALAVDSRGQTWDRVGGDFGGDVVFLDAALSHVFERCSVDPARVLLAGFSDGASYALSLGVCNGDLFTHLAAFSPGFLNSGPELVGKPRVFVSHGTSDPVLSVLTTREAIVPLLRDNGYDVRYEEFDGGHSVPASVFDVAMDWFGG